MTSKPTDPASHVLRLTPPRPNRDSPPVSLRTDDLRVDTAAGTATLWLAFDAANGLTLPRLERLIYRVAELETNPHLERLVIRSAVPRVFAGDGDSEWLSDLSGDSLRGEYAAAGQRLLNRLAAGPLVSVAVIAGAAHGAGCDLAMACDYRFGFATPAATLGYPLHPFGRPGCWGGRARGFPEDEVLSVRGALRRGLLDDAVCERRAEIELRLFLAKPLRKRTPPPAAALAAERGRFARTLSPAAVPLFPTLESGPLPRAVGVVGADGVVPWLAASFAVEGVPVHFAAGDDPRPIDYRPPFDAVRRALTPLEADQARARIVHDGAFDDCDLVVIADGGPTPLPAVEAAAGRRTVLALCRRDLHEASDLADRPGRVLGLEFPLLPGSKLIELLRGPDTEEAAMTAAAGWLRRVGYDTVSVAARPRAVVRRVLTGVWDEAVRLVAEGVAIETVDRDARALGIAPPLAAMDAAGLTTAVTLVPRLGPVLAAGLGADGFYTHPPDNPAMPNIVAQVVLWDARQLAAVRDGRPAGEPPPSDVSERLLLRAINAAAAALAGETVAGVADVDRAAALGAGVLVTAGGPLRFADATGLRGLVKRMKVQADAHGPRFLPHPELARRAAAGERFHDAGPPMLRRAAA